MNVHEHRAAASMPYERRWMDNLWFIRRAAQLSATDGVVVVRLCEWLAVPASCRQPPLLLTWAYMDLLLELGIPDLGILLRAFSALSALSVPLSTTI